MKLVKMFIEAGVGGIHFEDQKPGVKKCGHLGGKVLVSTREHVIRLQAARLQADIMGCDLVIVARTDAQSASFIDNNIDQVDHPFILGCADPQNKNKLLTFPEAGRQQILKNFSGQNLERILKIWDQNAYSISLQSAQRLAEELGFAFYLDWEACRTEEGYYRIKGSIEYCVARSIIFSDYADVLWMETDAPDLLVA